MLAPPASGEYDSAEREAESRVCVFVEERAMKKRVLSEHRCERCGRRGACPVWDDRELAVPRALCERCAVREGLDVCPRCGRAVPEHRMVEVCEVCIAV